MTGLFYQVLDMSRTGSLVIMGVVLLRFLLKKAPKIFSYALWAVVLVRLLCPVSVEAPVSILPETEPARQAIVSVSGPETMVSVRPQIEDGELIIRETQVGAEQPVIVTEAYAMDTEMDTGSWLFLIWLSGMGVMALYSLISYWKLKARLVGAVPLEKGLYLADHIPSPFVLGFFFPKIYLPSALGGEERAYILLHERHHIRRGDHIFKALAFLALTIHWFNPLVWLAFILAGKDMEMSCDEAVVKRLGEGIRADYSASLLSFATGRRIFAGTPLAFGEGDPKSRIRNLLNWKKPKFWVIILSAVLCVVLALSLLTDPVREKGFIRMTATDLSSSVQFELNQENLYGGRIILQHWVDGKCTMSSPVELDGKENNLAFYMNMRYEGAQVSGVQIQTDAWGSEDAVIYPRMQTFDFPVTGAVTGWGFSSFREDESVGLEPGDEHILAGWFFDAGTGYQTEVLSRTLIEQEPERLREADNAIVVILSFDDPDSEDFLTLEAMDTEPGEISLNYSVALGDWVEGGSVYPELWVDGECSTWGAADLPKEAKSLTIGLTMEEDGDYLTGMTCDLAAGALGIQGTIPLPEEKKIISWGLMSPEQGKPLQASRGDSRILAALYFDTGGGVRIIDCESLEKEPERLEQAECLLVIRVTFPRYYKLRYIENQPSEPKEVLTLDKILELSEKGEELTWADFEDYECSGDIGSGMYIRRYKTDSMDFGLTIGGSSLEEKPMYINLSHVLDSSHDDDIRRMDVGEYIRKYE